MQYMSQKLLKLLLYNLFFLCYFPIFIGLLLDRIFKKSTPLVSLYFSKFYSFDSRLKNEFTTFFTWRMCKVQVGTITDCPCLAHFKIALASACNTYHLVSPSESSIVFKSRRTSIVAV